MKFEQGQIYNTVKTLGVMLKLDGRLQISQHIGQAGGADISPTEKLIFSGRENGKLWFLREDGTKVCGHPSHFDQTHVYNRSEAGNAINKLEIAKMRVVRAEADLAKAVERLAMIVKEIGPDGVTNIETMNEQVDGSISTMTTEERNEVVALFTE